MKSAFVDLLYDGSSLMASFEDQIRQGLISFSFTDTRKGTDKFDLAIDGVDPAAADDLLVEEDDEVTVVLGVKDWQLSRKMIIDELGVTYGESVQLKVTGRCKAISLQNKKGECWKDKTDSEIATLIAQQNGLTPDVETTTERREQLAQGNRTYAQLLTWLARENDFTFRVVDDTLIFRSRGDEKPPVLTLYRGTGQLPALESFDLQHKRTRVRSGGKVKTGGKKKGTGKVEEETSPKDEEDNSDFHFKKGNTYTETQTQQNPADSSFMSVDVPVSQSGDSSLPDVQVTDDKGGETGTKKYNPSGQKDRAKKKAAATQSRILWKAVSASISFRDEKLHATEKVKVAGAIAEKHAGDYYADEVTFSLDGESILVKAQVQRKPFPKGKGKGKDKKKPNDGSKKDAGADKKDAGKQGAVFEFDQNQAGQNLWKEKSASAPVDVQVEVDVASSTPVKK